MKRKPYCGPKDSGYAKRRLDEIRKAQSPYRGLRVGLQEIIEILSTPGSMRGAR